jgi:hypothetical protein
MPTLLRTLMCPDSHFGSVTCKKGFPRWTCSTPREKHGNTTELQGLIQEMRSMMLGRQSGDLGWLAGREPASTFKARREFT